MKTRLHRPTRKPLILIAVLSVIGAACLQAADRKNDDPPPFKTHPRVFNLIECWQSDTVSPVVTEINLDAVEKNRNQFDADDVKQEDGWTVYRDAESKTTMRYRVIESTDNHYKVEYQENAGGTHTSSSIIEFSVVRREIRKHGKATQLRVLRLESHSEKLDPPKKDALPDVTTR